MYPVQPFRTGDVIADEVEGAGGVRHEWIVGRRRSDWTDGKLVISEK